MRILMSGSSGLVGGALLAGWSGDGHQVVRLVRREAQPGQAEVFWDPQAGVLPAASLSGFDAVVHLAGENIAAGRWTAARRRRIYESRVHGTSLLAKALAGAESKPKVLLCASAVGYYGNRGEEILDERSPAGTGFLSQVCHHWEAACQPAEQAGIRVVNLRLGVVLTPRGGMLAQVLPLFLWGLGGRLGNGQQYLSWIALDDLVEVFRFALQFEPLAGPVNAVAPQPVTNRQFTRALSRSLGRPALLPVPGIVLRLALGRMADELLLASARAVPRRLLEARFAFRHPNLDDALRAMLAR